MVEIREADENDTSTNSANEPGPSRNSAASGPAASSLTDFFKADPVTTVIAWLRILTLFFTVSYLLNVLGLASSKTSYSKAFIAAAASNLCRLHQRVRSFPRPLFSREFLSRLFLEDTTHYLLYCLSFLLSAPVTMAVFPVACYALLHTASYLLKVADVLGHGGAGWAEQLRRFQQNYTQSCLSTIACVEIFVFPVFCAMILTGKASFLFIFLHYRFLWLRYASQRNPHTRLAFQGLKYSLLDVANKPAVPVVAKSAILKCISIVENFAPPVSSS